MSNIANVCLVLAAVLNGLLELIVDNEGAGQLLDVRVRALVGQQEEDVRVAGPIRSEMSIPAASTNHS